MRARNFDPGSDHRTSQWILEMKNWIPENEYSVQSKRYIRHKRQEKELERLAPACSMAEQQLNRIETATYGIICASTILQYIE